MRKLPVPFDGSKLQPRPDMDPKLREAVRLYTDPLMPTFGNKRASGVAVGYADGQPLTSDVALAEIQRIGALRAEAAAKVLDYMGTFAFDAARELVQQMSAGRDLQILDPTPLLREATDDERLDALTQAANLAAMVKSDAGGVVTISTKDVLDIMHGERMDRADAMTKANRVALQAFRERREAVELILQYHTGGPGAAPRSGGSSDPSELDLSTLSNEDLRQLGDVIADVLEKKKGAAPKDDAPAPAAAVDGEFSVED